MLEWGPVLDHTVNPAIDPPVTKDAVLSFHGDIIDYSDGTSKVPVSLAFAAGDNLPVLVFAAFAAAPPDAGVTPDAFVAQPNPQGTVEVPAGYQPAQVLDIKIAGVPPAGTAVKTITVLAFAKSA